MNTQIAEYKETLAKSQNCLYRDPAHELMPDLVRCEFNHELNLEMERVNASSFEPEFDWRKALVKGGMV